MEQNFKECIKSILLDGLDELKLGYWNYRSQNLPYDSSFLIGFPFDVLDIKSKLLNEISAIQKIWSNEISITHCGGGTIAKIFCVALMLENTLINGIDDTICKIASTINTNKFKFKRIIILKGINIDKAIKLNDNLRIDKLINIEPFNKDPIGSCKCCGRFYDCSETTALVEDIDVNIGEKYVSKPFDYISMDAHFINYFRLITLITKHHCDFDEIYAIRDKDCFFGRPNTLSKLDVHFSKMIDKNITDQANNLLIKYKDFDNLAKEKIDHILFRFSQACSKTENFAALIELRVITEMLFEPSLSSISESISQRAGYFLGHNPKDRIDKAIEIKKYYNCASSAVHGQYIHKEEDERLIENFKEFLGSVIIKFINIGKFYNDKEWKLIIFGSTID